MESERWRRLQDLFHGAVELSDEERHLYLARICSEDVALRDEVALMIAGGQRAEVFLESTPFADAKWLVALEQRLKQSEAADSALIGSTVSHFRILERIGGGGVGVVYKAEDTDLGRFVALKFLSPLPMLPATRKQSSSFEYLPEPLRSLQYEARACSALDHPNICTVYEVGQHAGTSFIAMQLLTGRTLKEEISSHPLPVGKIVDLGIQIADGIGAAHGAGIIHRDIKSNNIFVTLRGEAKILDFGIAKVLPAGTATDALRLKSHPKAKRQYTLTQPDVPVGTAAYMSPEQVINGEIDERTDLFCFGVVLYEMATGSLPFEGASAEAIFEQILHREPALPSQRNSDVPSALEKIIVKAIEKDRSKRYRTAAELRVDLLRLRQTLQSGQSDGIKSISSKVWIAAAASVIVLFAGIGFSAYLRSRQLPEFAEKKMIVLAEFGNSTGEAVFDETLRQAFHAQLEQSPFLNILPDQNVRQELRYMGRAPDTPITLEVAREICLRASSNAVVTGAVSHIGKPYVMGVEAVDCRTGNVLVSERLQARDRDQVLPALGEAARKLRRRLGESLASIHRYDTPVEQATTSSLEALAAYSLAIKLRTAQGDQPAIPLFERAIEIDPAFAMAYARMGAAYATLNEPTRASAAIEKAYELRDRVSERERFYIDAHHFDLVTGQDDKAIQTYELWSQTYPEDVAPYVNSGVAYNQLGQHQKEVDEQLRALTLDPNLASAHANLTNAYLCLNEFDKAGQVLQDVQARKLEISRSWMLRYHLAFLRGDEAEMKHQMNLAAGQPEIENLAFAFRADTEAYHGRLRNAREFTRRAIESARRSGDPQIAIEYEIVGAMREAEFGNRSEAKRMLGSALRHDPGTRGKILAALASARAGSAARALVLADELKRQFPLNTLLNGYWLPVIQASSDLDLGDPRAAIDALETAKPYELGLPQTPTNVAPYPIYMRGVAWLADKRGPEAAAEFQKIIDHPGIVGDFPLGALAYLGLARSFSLSAATQPTVSNANQRDSREAPRQSDLLAESRRAYEKFFSLWSDADQGIPVLQQARAEYQKLSQERRPD
jgi:eukaryotic-like serine/threonine-protein kinase